MSINLKTMKELIKNGRMETFRGEEVSSQPLCMMGRAGEGRPLHWNREPICC